MHRKIDLTLTEASPLDAISTIANLAGFNFVIDPEVDLDREVKVTIDAVNVPARTVLRATIHALSLGLKIEGDMVRIVNRPHGRHVVKIIKEGHHRSLTVDSIVISDIDEIDPVVHTIAPFGITVHPSDLEEISEYSVTIDQIIHEADEASVSVNVGEARVVDEPLVLRKLKEIEVRSVGIAVEPIRRSISALVEIHADAVADDGTFTIVTESKDGKEGRLEVKVEHPKDQ